MANPFANFTLTWGHVIMVTVAVAAVIVGITIYVVRRKPRSGGGRYV